MRYYDYGPDRENRKIYGRSVPPKIRAENTSRIPILMIVASRDELGTPDDCEWLYKKLSIGTQVVYHGILGGHSTPLQAEDMSYVQDVVIPFI